jgi:3-dehydroquinate synthase
MLSGMKRLTVSLASGEYPVYIGKNLLERLPALLESRYEERRAVLATDSFLAPRAGKRLVAAFHSAGWNIRMAPPLPRGEAAKSFACVERLCGFMLKSGVERRTPLVTLGGGTVGDAAGFAAAVFQRGIPLVQVPTTLLAQVDSSVGGKTAVNHPLAKNAMGVFYQPRLVLCDVALLRSLPKRDFLSGMAEAIKYALVFDSAFARWLDRNWSKILRRDTSMLLRVVYTSLAWKARVVAEDEYDLIGRRELLNFGHTVGHALEATTKYRHFRHGEAVAWGMRVALALSEGRGWMSSIKERRLSTNLLNKLHPPVWPENVNFSRVIKYLRYDKKRRGARNIFVLLRALGRPARVTSVSLNELRRALTSIGLR